MTLTEIKYFPYPEFFLMLNDLQHNFYIVNMDTVLKQDIPMILPVTKSPRFYKPRSLISNNSEFVVIGRST